MSYVTICAECLADDCENCGKSKLIPERKRLSEYNEGTLGGGICVCGHGEPESTFQQSVRNKLK